MAKKVGSLRNAVDFASYQELQFVLKCTEKGGAWRFDLAASSKTKPGATPGENFFIINFDSTV